MIPDQHAGSTLTGATVPIVSSAVSIVYELLCLLLTIAKTFSLHREQQQVGISTQLTALLLHDGESSSVALYQTHQFTSIDRLTLLRVSRCAYSELRQHDLRLFAGF